MKMIEKILTYFPLYILMIMVLIVFGGISLIVYPDNPTNMFAILTSGIFIFVGFILIRSLIRFIKKDSNI